MLKIAICDDEKLYLDKIEKTMREILNDRGISDYVIDQYLSGSDLLQKKEIIAEYQVVFLDINMPHVNGLEIAREIRGMSSNILLVFITAFMDYAVEGYKMEAIRFLLKDMLDEMLPECIETIIKKLTLQAKKIRYQFLEGEKEIYIDKIYFIESQKHKLIFNIFEGKIIRYSLYDKLDNVEDVFLPYGFLRIHKSYLVNTKYIADIVNYQAKMINGIILSIPRERYAKVKERYYEIKGDML